MRRVGIALLIVASLTGVNGHQGEAAEWDPTRPYGPAATAPSQQRLQSVPRTVLNLSAIFYSPVAAKAVINGKTVSQGEMIKGCRVVSIDAQRVVVKDARGMQTLTLRPKGIKQLHRADVSTEGAS